MLTLWRDSQAVLQQQVDGPFLLQEVMPLSATLEKLAIAGLQSMDYTERGEHPPEAWKVEQLALIEQSRKPQAQLLIAVAPPIQKLIETSVGQGAPFPAK